MKFIVLSFFILASVGTFADQNKQALKALEKGDYEDAESHLIRSLEKNVINPGAKYIYSLLYTTPSFPRYNIDSAYYFILKAISDMEYSGEKILKDLAKNEISRANLDVQKVRVEGLAFERSLGKNSIQGFDYFIDHFSTARQVDNAIKRRDQLAFDQIRAVDSWQAYDSFIKDYPDAEQVPLARKEYERLLYRDYTRDGKLQSLQSFLVQYPDNDHRAETEYKILKIISALNRPRDYLDFIRTYPQSPHVHRAAQMLFHVDRDFYGLRHFNDYAKPRSFRDSLENVIALNRSFLVPFYQNDLYGFMNADGNVILQNSYDYIKEEYLCGNITSDVLEVRERNQLKLVNHQGIPVFEGGFDVATDLGAGLVKMRKNARYGVWHKAGFDILPGIFDDVDLLAHNLLKTKEGAKWGLHSVFGEELLSPQFDDIHLVDDYWIFEKDGLLAVANLDYLKPLTDNESITLDFKYDEVELVKQNYLLCYSGRYESLINTNLDVVINSSDQTIIPMLDDWIVKRDSGYSYYYEENGTFLEDSFRDISFSRNWLAFKRDSLWTLLSQGFGFEPRFQLDSARILNDHIAFFEKNDTAFIAFYPRRIVQLAPDDEIRLLGVQQVQDSSQYLLIRSESRQRVYSQDGKLNFAANYDEIDYLSQGHFTFGYRKKRGILDAAGSVVLEARFEAVGQVKDSLAPVLQKGEFGLFDLSRGLLIEPGFRKKLDKYGNKYLVGLREEGYGFLDFNGAEISEFNFVQIEYWNDEVALVKLDKYWILFDINSEGILLNNIQSIEYLKDSRDEKIAYILTDRGFGVFSNTRGEILTPSFNDIINLGTVDRPLFFAEKHVPEAEFYLVVYADENGETLKSQAFREEEYRMIYCDQ